MKEHLKSILKKLNLYHPLQSAYRSSLSFIRNQYLKLVYARFKGSGFQCNFCGLVKAVLQTYLSIDGKKILHFSPEKHLFRFINKTAHVTTVDITPGFYRNIDNSIRYADATNLPFAAGSFDILIANHILEHIPEDIKAMKEMFRVLDANGLAILQVPYSETLPAILEDPNINDPARQAALYGQKDHVRIYTKAGYIQCLRQAGFHVNILTPEVLAPFRIHAIQENESVFLCSKRPHHPFHPSSLF